MRALIDTSALLALSRRRDQYHDHAVRIAEKHLAVGGRYLATISILCEVHGHLVHLRDAPAAREAIARLLVDPIHEWMPVDSALIADAVAHWLDRFRDQAFTLVDAVSFEVMKRERVTHAFAFDHHFTAAGFALLD